MCWHEPKAGFVVDVHDFLRRQSVSQVYQETHRRVARELEIRHTFMARTPLNIIHN